MPKTSMRVSSKASPKKHACLPPTRPSTTWTGTKYPSGPAEVPHQFAPTDGNLTPQHHNMAVEGSELNLKTPD